MVAQLHLCSNRPVFIEGRLVTTKDKGPFCQKDSLHEDFCFTSGIHLSSDGYQVIKAEKEIIDRNRQAIVSGRL